MKFLFIVDICKSLKIYTVGRYSVIEGVVGGIDNFFMGFFVEWIVVFSRNLFSFFLGEW